MNALNDESDTTFTVSWAVDPTASNKEIQIKK
jgi:hypothetical protein